MLRPSWRKPERFNPLIRVDQFGYLPTATKVAVLADPQQGFNSAESFSPGSTYEVRTWPNEQTVLTVNPVAWDNGNIHAQSGDKGWWVDFSSVQQPGTYYLYDVANQESSYLFEIGENVYQDVLKAAMRVYYYQRLNTPKLAQYAGNKWVEGAVFDGPEQDREARSRWSKQNASTAKDVHGGWMDAGDANKYTTFARDAVLNLLQAYLDNPGVFTDDYNIPESGNGIPDILDELMFELDWLKRMQDATGTNGLLLKVGNDNYNGVHPPSADTRPRFYLPECTSATLTGAALFAKAGVVLDAIPSLQTYASDMISRAEGAFQRGKTMTQDFTLFQQNCDDGDIKSGDADQDEMYQRETAIIAAAYLYAATGNTTYRDFVINSYSNVRPYSENWWGPYNLPTQDALLYFTTLSGVNGADVNAIRGQKSNMDYVYSLLDYQAEKDLYRAHLEDWAHHWGSNQIRAHAGNLNLSFVYHDVNTSQADDYREAANSYLHWLHGVNPLGMVMLSNMYELGGDNCVNEIYHLWFDNNTDYDNALTSPKGPAPGYLSGGPNVNFTANISPPLNQPPQKAYKDWNTSWPENSWEITEPAIYYQAAYVLLLSRLMPESSAALPVEWGTFEGFRTKTGAVDLHWQTFDEINNDGFSILRSLDGRKYEEIGFQQGQNRASWYQYTDQDAPRDQTLYYQLKQTDKDGRNDYSERIEIAATGRSQLQLLDIRPNPVKNRVQVYYEADLSGELSWELIDVQGRQVMASSLAERQQNGLLDLELSSIPTGIYMLHIRSREASAWAKLQKE